MSTNYTINVSSSPNVDFIWYASLSLIICSTGMITNLINICIFCHPSLKEPCFKFMLTNSIAGFAHLSLINFYPFAIFCKCPFSQSYSSAIFNIVVKNHVGPCLATFRIIYEICLSFHVYCLLINTSRFKWITKNYFILIMLVVSFAYYLPVSSLKTVVASSVSGDGGGASIMVYSVSASLA